MTTELTYEEMRRALFAAPQAPTPHVPLPNPMAHIPDVLIVPPPALVDRKKKPSHNVTPRLRVALRVSNEFEGER